MTTHAHTTINPFLTLDSLARDGCASSGRALFLANRRIFNVSKSLSEIELQGKLNQPRVITCGGDAAEITRINDLSSIWISKGGVEIAVRVGEVDLVAEIEELSAKLDIL